MFSFLESFRSPEYSPIPTSTPDERLEGSIRDQDFSDGFEDALTTEKAMPTSRQSRRDGAGKLLFLLLSYGYMALPRFLRPGSLECSSRIHATSYLDAVRGFAAFFVMNSHHFEFNQTWFFKLPIIRVWKSGAPMVDVFYVISGFVLTQGLVKKMHSRQRTAFLDSISSSVFRRHLRLYLPTIPVSFFAMLLASMGWTDRRIAAQESSLWVQFLDWFRSTMQFINPFAPLTGHQTLRSLTNKYLPVAWTIPVEFQGSLAAFAFCLATYRLKPSLRLSAGLVIYGLAIHWQATHVALFVVGICIAEISLLSHPERYTKASMPVTESGPTAANRRSSYVARFFLLCGCTVVFIFSTYLLGLGNDWPFFTTKYRLFDGIEFLDTHSWSVLAAPALILCLDFCPLLQWIFTKRFPQYLGDLSFGIYLMHWVVLHSLYTGALMPWLKHTSGGFLARAVANLIYWVVVFWCADYFHRMDQWIVRVVKGWQQKFFEA